jgi:hypothetical protein
MNNTAFGAGCPIEKEMLLSVNGKDNIKAN